MSLTGRGQPDTGDIAPAQDEPAQDTPAQDVPAAKAAAVPRHRRPHIGPFVLAGRPAIVAVGVGLLLLA